MLRKTPDKRVSVCVVLVDEETNMPWMQLSLKRGWELIGGKVDPGESPIDALCREVREEVGLKLWECARCVQLAGVIDHDEWICLCYVALLKEGTVPTVCEPHKVTEIRRLPVEEVKKLVSKDKMWKRAIQVLTKFWYPAEYKEHPKRLKEPAKA